MRCSPSVWSSLACTCVLVVGLFTAGCATTSTPSPPRMGAEVPPGQDVKLAVYNIAFGALVGGAGALINGSDAPPLRRFARGAGWGAAGGSAAYAGKWLAGGIGASESLAWGWPSVLLHAAGTSVVENAAYDRPPLDRLSVDVAFLRLDVIPSSGAVRARVMPVSAISLALMAAEHDLDLGRSLALGFPVFTGDGPAFAPLNLSGRATDGFAFPGSVYLAAGTSYELVGHELIHILQLREFARMAVLYAPLDRSLARSSTYRALSRWIYLDNPAMMVVAYYGIEGGARAFPCYFNNWLEREAEAFGYRRPVETCS
ncbi:MAG: hypothetical protein AAF970_19940 [Bacteroidota bacterium]